MHTSMRDFNTIQLSMHGTHTKIIHTQNRNTVIVFFNNVHIYTHRHTYVIQKHNETQPIIFLYQEFSTGFAMNKLRVLRFTTCDRRTSLPIVLQVFNSIHPPIKKILLYGSD